MKAIQGIILSLLLCSVCLAEKADEPILRTLFHKVTNENDLDSILSYQTDKSSFIANAYFGAALAMKAQYPFLPTKKLSYFSDGKNLIEKSINEKQVIENTYLRLLIQLNSPKILGYYDDIQKDIDYISLNIDSSYLSIEWKIKVLEQILLLESKEYNYLGIKEKLAKHKA
jgi:hypothetical protein